MSRSFHLVYTSCILYFLYNVLADATGCQMQQTQMTLSRQVNVVYQGQSRSANCQARITVSKCEGRCESFTEPRGGNEEGIHRVCQCCRETDQHRRDVELVECYDGDQQLYGIAPVSTSLVEPTGCSCHYCRN